MHAEFEEKEYENSLYPQILGSSNTIWSPGQVFEEYLGFDAGMYVSNPYFWQQLGYRIPPVGASLNRYDWGHLWKKRTKRRLPAFSLNLFVQTKRPDVFIRPSVQFQSKGIQGRYYQFEIQKHQQIALEKVDSKLGGRALICYAAPVFHRVSDLYYHIDNNSLVNHSTFPSSSSLTGHKYWVYQQHGANGWGLSDPKAIEQSPLLSRIEETVKRYDNFTSDEVNLPLQSLQALSTHIDDALREFREPGSARVREYIVRTDRLNEFRGESFQPIFHFTRIQVFCDVFNLQWFTLGQER